MAKRQVGGGFNHYTGAAVGCGGRKDHINTERASAYFKGSINLNGGTIHASYSGENLYGAAVIGAVDERPSATINIKAKCKIYVKKGENSSGKAMMPMKANTVNLQNVTEGSTVYSSKVYNIDNTSDIAPAANRVAWCTAANDNKSIAIVPCEHDGDAEYTDLGEIGHKVSCYNCTVPAEEITKPHSWGEAVYTWADDNSSVTGECSCKLCGREESETVAAKYVVTYEPTCVSKGKAKYESGFFRKSCFEIQSKPAADIDPNPNNHLWFIDEMTEDSSYCDGYKIESHCIWCRATKTSDKHDWGETTYTWDEDNSKVTAKHVCNKCNHTEEETVDTVYTVTEEASCVAEGEASYTASFTKAGFEKQIKTGITVPINPNNHDWDEPTYKWTDDNSSVKATRVCANDASHVETETASTASEVTTPATCEGKGETTYTAEFENEAFEIQTKTVENINPIGHAWGEPTYEWAEDNSSVTATRVCANDASHVETETVSTTSEVSKPATCEGKGETTYTAEFENEAFKKQKKTVDNIDPLGHDWGEPTYEWAEDNSFVTATRVCTHDASHKETETATATYEIIKQPTCEEKGETTYKSAAFENEAFTVQTKTEDIDALGHDWDEGTVTKKPSTKEEGEKTFTCKLCGATRTERIPKLNPSPDKKASTSKPVLVAKGISSGKSAVKVSWNKVNGADRYVVYLTRCNHKGRTYTFKKIRTVNAKTLKLTKNKLRKNTAYKFYVVAQKKSGGSYKNIAKSRQGHFFTGNVKGGYTNPKNLKLSKPAYNLKKGRSATIKASVSKARAGKRLATNHAARLRFTSNNPKVAAVNAKGKITAKGKGTATIYVQTINGIWKTCRVTVK